MSLHEVNILNDLNRELLMLIERCVIFTDYISVNNYGCLLQPINLNEEKKKQYIKHIFISSYSKYKLKLDNWFVILKLLYEGCTLGKLKYISMLIILACL